MIKVILLITVIVLLNLYFYFKREHYAPFVMNSKTFSCFAYFRYGSHEKNTELKKLYMRNLQIN